MDGELAAVAYNMICELEHLELLNFNTLYIERINIEIYDYPYNFSFRNCPLSSLFFSLFLAFFVCFIYTEQALDDESDTNADRAEDQCQLQTGHITHGYVQ